MCGFTDEYHSFEDIHACPSCVFCPSCRAELDQDGLPALLCGNCDGCRGLEHDVFERESANRVRQREYIKSRVQHTQCSCGSIFPFHHIKLDPHAQGKCWLCPICLAGRRPSHWIPFYRPEQQTMVGKFAPSKEDREQFLSELDKSWAT